MMKFRFNCIHTVSNATKNDIQKIGTTKPIHIIPNCIQDEQSVSVELKSNQFVYLGRLVFYKNVEVILRAWSIIIKEVQDAKLIIAGDGPHKSALQELVKKLDIKDSVIFTGYVTPDQKKKLLCESNALLFPSMIEGFGLVMLESWQQNRPVLASNIPPMSDIIQHEKTGLVIDTHDEKKWAEKIIQLIKNPNISDEMGKAGNRVLKIKYNQELFYENLIKMYSDVLSKNP